MTATWIVLHILTIYIVWFAGVIGHVIRLDSTPDIPENRARIFVASSAVLLYSIASIFLVVPYTVVYGYAITILVHCLG